MTRKEGVPGEKEEVISVSVGKVVKEPDGGTKVMMAKRLLVTVTRTGGSEGSRIRMARASRSGQLSSTVSGTGKEAATALL